MHATPVGAWTTNCPSAYVTRRGPTACDQDLDGGTVGGYGPQVIDAVYTLAKALDTLSSDDREDRR